MLSKQSESPTMKRIAVCAIALVLVASCGGPKTDTREAAAAPGASSPVEVSNDRSDASKRSLPEFFDCVRESGGMLIAAHRGGPDGGFPENAIETLQHARGAGIQIMEIDVNESRDGVLFLHHDDRLARTTTGDGYVSDTAWDTLSGLKLKDRSGKVTPYSPPKLTDALLWAKQNDAILELDRKDTTSFKNIVAAVKAAGAEEYVIYISYNDEQAAEISRLAPEAMLTASAFGDRNVEALETRGIDRSRLIAWTGTREPYPDAWARVREIGVEPAFGTLGRAGENLDEVYWQDGDGREYQEMAEQGLVLLATDAPYRVAEAIKSDDIVRQKCPR